MYLAITVLATITLYYELYVGGSVSTLLLPNLHMSFTFYVLHPGLREPDRRLRLAVRRARRPVGRANLVVFGLLFTGVFTAFIMPARHQQVGLHASSASSSAWSRASAWSPLPR